MQKNINNINKIAILSESYPEENNIYQGMYIHTRVISYKKKKYDCIIYRISNCKNRKYIFEGIEIFIGNSKYIKEKIKEYDPDVICMHAPNSKEQYFILKNFFSKKILCWIHGLDAMSGAFKYPYDGNILLTPIKFIRRLLADIIKFFCWKIFIAKINPKIIGVSKFSIKEMEAFLLQKINNYSIIPNPIDNHLFKFKQRIRPIKKIICIRSLNTKKYAVDIAIKAFSNSKYQLHIYGKGKLLNYYKKLAKKYNSNIIFFNKFFNRKELAKLFEQYDLGIMPTKLDSQGVMVCEMLISGIPIITSEIGMGNSEYKTNGSIFFKNEDFIKKNITNEINSINIEEMSKKAHIEMINLSGIDMVIKKELKIITN